MIKNTNIIESNRIGFSLNYELANGTKAISFTQEGDTKIAVLDVKQASKYIVHRILKNPEKAHRLRWVRKTRRNKQIMAEYLMRRLVKNKLAGNLTFYYMPCCNSFSSFKPSQNQDHNMGIKDCLLLLLGKEDKSRAIAFKKQEREKNKSIYHSEFIKLFRPKILPFFKDKTPLE